MTNWKTLIPGCFAGMTAPFGVHPYDHQRAVKMLRLALREGATIEDICNEARRWLEQQNFTETSIEREIKRIESFQPNPYHRKKLSSAWLITWEGTSPPEKQSERIVSIIGYRTSSGRVLGHVEQLYVDQLYSLHEKITYARHKSDNPYHAEFVRLNGVRWEGQITCGHNPYLWARRVKNLVLQPGINGEDILIWDEIPLPKPIE